METGSWTVFRWQAFPASPDMKIIFVNQRIMAVPGAVQFPAEKV